LFILPSFPAGLVAQSDNLNLLGMMFSFSNK
jgi:hypothetical protein